MMVIVFWGKLGHEFSLILACGLKEKVSWMFMVVLLFFIMLIKFICMGELPSLCVVGVRVLCAFMPLYKRVALLFCCIFVFYK